MHCINRLSTYLLTYLLTYYDHWWQHFKTAVAQGLQGWFCIFGPSHSYTHLHQPSDWQKRLFFAPFKWLAGKIVSNMTFNVSSGMLNHTIIIIIPRQCLWCCHHGRAIASSPGSFDECRTATSGRRPKTKPDDLGCESACTGCQSLHPPSPFIIITQPESWYSFYRPTEGRRLSRPSWLVTYRDGLPVHRQSPILVLTRSDVAQLRWSRPTRYH